MHTRQTRPLARARWLVPAAALTLLGCPDNELAPLEPCTVAGVTEDITQTGVDTVDVLFVIDNSGSMSEEQANLAEQLPRLVQILASGDLKLDGLDGETGKPGKDFQPVSNLHLGVVSSDMGVAGVSGVPKCNHSDDGLLLNRVSTTDTQCAGLSVPPYQEFKPPADDAARNMQAADVAQKFKCVSQLGTNGCGFEQPLESMWKALAPSSDTNFITGAGHGDDPNGNAGFLRPDAVLAVILVSDEEDCSITKQGTILFDNGSTDTRVQGQGLNARCGLHAEDKDLVQPVSRYIEGLQKLKSADKQDRLVFAAIAGIPFKAEKLPEKGGVQDFEAILNLDDMKVKLDGPEDDPNTFIVPACTSDNGSASPARRATQVAQAFGANGLVRSICNKDFDSALDAILDKISKHLSGACLPRALNANDKGVVECDVVEILRKNDTQCDASRGRVFREMREIDDGDVRTVCTINQVAVNAGDNSLKAAPNPVVKSNPLTGWYYDNFSEEVTKNCDVGSQQRIGFTAGADLAPGAKASFECFSPVGGSASAKGKAAVGSACIAGTNDVCKTNRSEEGGYQLLCEPTTRTCQITCQADSDCPNSWVCSPDASGRIAYCVNPTCPPTQSTGSTGM